MRGSVMGGYIKVGGYAGFQLVYKLLNLHKIL